MAMTCRGKSVLFFILAGISGLIGAFVVIATEWLVACILGIIVFGSLGFWFYYFRPFVGRWNFGDDNLQIKFFGKWFWSNGLNGYWEPDGKNRIKCIPEDGKNPILTLFSFGPSGNILKGPFPKYFWTRVKL